ncbi:hypothetical protein BDZ91DRAFT_729715 [Kalaharituber pfeilii]|nr:hypothetical protein BDZ91DRAFT_729715 [Kalaharituber pfeilii]
MPPRRKQDQEHEASAAESIASGSKRPRKNTDADEPLHHGSPSRNRNYGARARPRATLPAYKRLTITKHVEKTESNCSDPELAIATNDTAEQLESNLTQPAAGVLDKFRFQGGNGMTRGIRSGNQQQTVKTSNYGGSDEQSPSHFQTGQPEEDEYDCTINYNDAVIAEASMLQSKNNAQAMHVQDGHETSEQFNTVIEEMEDLDTGQSSGFQPKILVEEEGLYEGYEACGDYIVLTPSQSGSQQLISEDEHPVFTNTVSTSTEFHELPNVIEYPASPFREFEIYPRQSAKGASNYVDDTVQERFFPPSDIDLGYGDESPEIFDPNLPCVVTSDEESKTSEEVEEFNEFNDDFNDDDLWKEVALKNFYIPRNSDPPTEDPLAWMEEISSSSTIAADVDMDLVVEPEAQPGQNPITTVGFNPVPTSGSSSIYKAVQSSTSAKGKGKAKISLPPTLISPISHISNPNPNPGDMQTSSSRRMLIFPPNSTRLERVNRNLAILNRLNDPEFKDAFPLPGIPVTNANTTATKWAHLPPEERQRPFARPPYAAPAKERSVIEGLSTKKLLRVCFRIGEALRVANLTSAGSWGDSDVLTELYGLYNFASSRMPLHVTNALYRVE